MTMEVLHASLIISPLHVFIHFSPHSHSGFIQNRHNGWVFFFFSYFFPFDCPLLTWAHVFFSFFFFFTHSHFCFLSITDLTELHLFVYFWTGPHILVLSTGQESSPKPSTSPPHLGSPGRKPHKSPSEPKERKQSSSDDKKKVVRVCFIWWEAQMIQIHYNLCFCFVGGF